jgi:hypothetical protein
MSSNVLCPIVVPLGTSWVSWSGGLLLPCPEMSLMEPQDPNPKDVLWEPVNGTLDPVSRNQGARKLFHSTLSDPNHSTFDAELPPKEILFLARTTKFLKNFFISVTCTKCA